jgi:hypothetical protein
MLQGVGLSQYSYWAGGARLNGYEHSLIGEKAVCLPPEGAEALLQSRRYGTGQPEV